MEKAECSYILKHPLFLARNTQSLSGFSCSQVFFTKTLRQLKHLILCSILAAYSMGRRKEGTEWITKQGMTFSFQWWSLCSITVRKNLSTWVWFPQRICFRKIANAAHVRRCCLKKESQGFSNKAETLHIPRNPYLSSLVLPGTWRGWDQRNIPDSSFSSSSFAKSPEADHSGTVDQEKKPQNCKTRRKGHPTSIFGWEMNSLREQNWLHSNFSKYISAQVQRQRPERGDSFAYHRVCTHEWSKRT